MRGRKRKIRQICRAAAVLFLVLLLLRVCCLYVKETKLKGSRDTIGAYFSNQIQGQILKTYLPSLSYILKEKEGSSLAEALLTDQVPVLKYVKMQMDYETSIEDADTYNRILKQEANDENEKEALWEALLNENHAVSESQSDNSIPPAPVPAEIDFEELNDYATLVSKYYAIDRTTSISAEQLNVEKLLANDMSLQGGSILIYHTHSQEGYVDSVPGDITTGVVGLGDRLTELLRARGYTVIHDRGTYDLNDRDYAYAKAGEALERILLEHPEIEVIIDLHRDGVSEEKRLVTEVNGNEVAQFMFFNGLSRTTTLGDIAYLPNEYIAENLSFTFQLQLEAQKQYPGLARKIYLKGYRYNLHYRGKSLLVEVGAQTNTCKEALLAIEPLAEILDAVLTPKEPQS